MTTHRSLAPRLLLTCMMSLSACVFAAAIFTPNNMPTGWVGEVDVSNFNFSSNTQTIFKSDYIKGTWSGNLYAFPVESDGTIDFSAERWGGAASNIDAQNYDTGRLIVTMKSDGTKIPFRWASLSTTQQAAIDNSKDAATIGPKVINYVRGDRSNENPAGSNYRKRTSAMGDIIHSRPLYVYDASDPRVYVGGNDGMLHSFDADSGDEVWAYVPSFFISPASTNFSNIKALTVDPYVHNYFVDGSPNARTVTISGATKTILVGGVGAGGMGLYALDITDPSPASETTAASKILWEITPTTLNNTASTAYQNLGTTFGIPVIAQVSDGTWVVIVGNGYNQTAGADQAVLYIINLSTGAKIAEIATSVTGTSNTNPNGLSSVTAVDADRDGKVDYVYAGDISGNLWKFDIRTVASPVVTKLYTTSPAQAITGRPTVSLHPNGGYMINFASGRMFTTADSTDTSTGYYAYGIWDNGTTIDTTKIVSQTLTAKTYTSGVFNYNVRVSSSNTVDYTPGSSQKQGWKLALPAGERVVGDGGLVTNSRYVFTSTNPTTVYAAVAGVAQPQGDNWLNEVDYLSGGGGTSPVFDLDANLQIDDDDRVRSSGTTAQTGPTGIPVSRFIVSGVLSQPLVAQLETLSETYFNSNPDATASVASSTDPGVSGGHFDFDIYTPACSVSGTKYTCPKDTHVHQYDDIYNVTGVNMLNASLASFNLVNAIPLTTTQFKILVANQKMSPAANFMVGGATAVRFTSYETTAGLTMASLPTYTRANIGTLTFALPLDAFLSKDWTGTGDVRAGLVPTQTPCVQQNTGGTTGPWMNGALTIQIVKSTTPDSAVQLNVAGDPTMGYRLKTDATSQAYQLAQYTTFWHHPNGKCIADAGWVKNPPQDTTGTPGKTSAPAAGSADPSDGDFGTIGTVSTGGGSSGGSVAGPSSTVTYTNADGSTVTQTSVKNADGSITVTRVYSYGGTDTFTIPPGNGGLQADTRTKTGRVSWREMIRP